MSGPQTTDVVVLGAGPGGYESSIRLAQLGKKVVVVERSKLGGICLNEGCIPSKALLHAARLLHEIRKAPEMGIRVDPPRLDLSSLQVWKRGVVEGLRKGIEGLLKSNGVEVLQGVGRFRGPREIVVSRREGETLLRFEHAIVATGSRPIEIPSLPWDGKRVIDSTAALEIEEIPPTLAVIGGGFIGLELGQAFRRFGSEVTIVEALEEILPGQDPEGAGAIRRAFEKEGIVLRTRTRAVGIDSEGLLLVETPTGKERIRADRILVAVGRRPNTSGIGLEEAGVRLDPKGYIPVDSQGRTNVPSIFAIGDVVAGPQLAHKASKEGLVAAHAIAGDPGASKDFRALPFAVFTDPELSFVGLSEAEAIQAGYDVVVGRFPFSALGRARTTGETSGFVKLVVERKSDRILGALVVGPHASDLIAEIALALEMGATATDLALTVHTHPTLPEAIWEAAESIHGRAIHVAPRRGPSHRPAP